MQGVYAEDPERIVGSEEGWDHFRRCCQRATCSSFSEDARGIPTTSYGIIEYVMADHEVHYHLFRMRNTCEYSEFIRGFINDRNLFNVLCLLSSDERERIKTHDFETLWDDFWSDHSVPGYSKSRRHAEQAHARYCLDYNDIFDHIPVYVDERQLTFPKGKAEAGERALSCAMREFQEETNHSLVGKLRFRDTVVERHIGTNGKRYRSEFFVWESNSLSKDIPEKTDSPIRPETLSFELEESVWLSFPKIPTHAEFVEWTDLHEDDYVQQGLPSRHFRTLAGIHARLGVG